MTVHEDDVDTIRVEGAGLRGLRQPDGPVDCGNSGTTLRLLAGILAGQEGRFELTGDESLRRRPMERIAEPLALMGASVETDDGKPPLVVEGGELNGIRYELPVASAQVKSCVLLAGLYAQGRTTVVEPVPTRDHTERLLAAAGAPVTKRQGRVSVGPAESLRLGSISVPGDFSAAAPFLVAATLLPGSELTIHDVGLNPTRTGLLDVLERMGARITIFHRQRSGGEPIGDLEVHSAELTATAVRAEEIPRLVDELPLFALVGSLRARGEQSRRRTRAARERDGPDRNRDDCATESRRPHHSARRRLPRARRAHASEGRDGELAGRSPHRHPGRRGGAGLESRRRSRRSGGGRCKLPRVFRAAGLGHTTMIVAIDGPAGAGKSTVARRLAERLGFRYLDTGAMYRALTWLARQRSVPLAQGEQLGELAAENPVSFDEQRRVWIAGTDVTSSIRKADIDSLVPVVARHPAVRAVMRTRQQELADDGNVVIEGRDIGTVVAPQAEVKIYLNADRGVRASRRLAERPEIGADALATDLRLRDESDAARMRPAEDAVQIDTTDLDVEDVVTQIEELVRARQPA